MDTSNMAGLSNETRAVLEQAMKALTYGSPSAPSRAAGNGTHLSPPSPPVQNPEARTPVCTQPCTLNSKPNTCCPFLRGLQGVPSHPQPSTLNPQPPQPRDEWSPEGLQHRVADKAASPQRRAVSEAALTGQGGAAARRSSPERRAAEMLLTQRQEMLQPRGNNEWSPEGLQHRSSGGGGYWPGAQPKTSSVPHPPAPCAAFATTITVPPVRTVSGQAHPGARGGPVPRRSSHTHTPLFRVWHPPALPSHAFCSVTFVGCAERGGGGGRNRGSRARAPP